MSEETYNNVVDELVVLGKSMADDTYDLGFIRGATAVLNEGASIDSHDLSTFVANLSPRVGLLLAENRVKNPRSDGAPHQYSPSIPRILTNSSK